MAYQTGTLTGTYQLFDGTPAQGVVEIIPSEPVVRDTSGNVIMSGRVRLTLDDAGHFSVVLPASDDGSLDPSGFGYTVAAKLRHAHLPAVSFLLNGGTTLAVEDAMPSLDLTTTTTIRILDGGQP